MSESAKKDLKKQFAGLACNFLPASTRLEVLEGKNYTVVPMVILTEGVHAGSQGPLFYPTEELSKTPAAWNHKPLVVYHPAKDGVGVSACDPEILNTRKIGLMLNTKFEGGRLKSEAWIDADRANEVDERIMVAVNAKEMMELSTGVFIDVEETAGDWNGESYAGIARNYRPDHLALLPDQIGACSINDGAGLLRNQATGKTSFRSGVLAALKKLGLVDNDLSYSTIQSLLASALREKFPEGKDGPWLWVADVYSNFCIYERDGKLFRLGYMSNDTGIVLSDETPVEVKRVTEYRTVSGALAGNRQPPTQPNPIMNKTTIILAILAANAGWAEKDKPVLEAMSEDQLKVIQNGLPKPTPPPVVPPPATTNTPPPLPTAPAAPAAPVTMEAYIAAAPAGVREVLQNSMEALNTEKNALIAAILANASNGFTKEDLATRPLGDLRNLARLANAASTAPVAIPHYAGLAPTSETVTNAEVALALPSMEEPAAK